MAEFLTKRNHDAGEAPESMQFLSFMLGDEEYGVDILSVREIRGWEPVSRIPNVPSYEKGVLNLRGTIVPIIDLRERFGLNHTGYTPFTVVVVLQIGAPPKNRIMGVVVDAVIEVVDIDKATIQRTPEFGGHVKAEFIKGLATVEQRMLRLLDVDQLLNLEGLDDKEAE